MQWTRRTLFKGKESIFGRLRLRFPNIDPNQYISICALRNWQIHDNIAYTEMVILLLFYVT